MEKSERVASSRSLARPLRAEKRASTTDSNGEREREREGRGNEIRLLPLHYLRPSSSLRRVMVRVRERSGHSQRGLAILILGASLSFCRCTFPCWLVLNRFYRNIHHISTLCLGRPFERFCVLTSGRVCGRACGNRRSSKRPLRHKVL